MANSTVHVDVTMRPRWAYYAMRMMITAHVCPPLWLTGRVFVETNVDGRHTKRTRLTEIGELTRVCQGSDDDGSE